MATKKAARKSTDFVKIYAMPTTPAIHVGKTVYPVDPNDRSLIVPAGQVKDFIKMGCTKEPPE